MTKSEVKSGTASGSTQSRARLLLSRLCSDPWRKGTSIVLAVLLWYFLDSRLTKETTLICELHVVDSEKNAVTDPTGPDRAVLDFRLSTREYSSMGFRAVPGDTTITEVVLHFRGPDHLIDSIKPSKEKFHVRDIEARAGNTFFEFDRSMIQGPRDLVQALVKMEPSRVALDVEKNDVRPINLSAEDLKVLVPPDTTGNGDTPYYSRLLLEKATFKPASVTLFGTQSDLAKFPDKQMFELDLRKRGNEFNGIEIKGKLRLLTIKDQDGNPIPVGCAAVPDITIPLRPKYEHIGLYVPVTVDLKSTNYKEGDFQPVPDHKVNLRVNSNLSLAMEIHRLDPAEVKDYLRVFVHVPKEKGPDRAIEPKLVFLQHPDLVRGRDYTFDMMAISLKLKDKND